MRENITLIITMLALSSHFAAASDFGFSPIGDNRFDSRVDLNNLNWFDRGIYKASLPYQDCVDLKEFYAYADSNQFDSLDRSDADSYRYRLSYRDYKKLAEKDPFDAVAADDYHIEDLRCSPLTDYQEWAKSNPSYTDDDYFELFGYDNKQDYERRYDQYPAYDYYYPVDFFGLVRIDGNGGYSSWVPLDRDW